jgi:antitoxin component of MazEF toxin-antitoxin module
MTTAVAQWGNSYAIRVPREQLRLAGLVQGDKVDIRVNQQGYLEIIPAGEAHRRVRPSRLMSYEELFKDYRGGRLDNREAWPDDGFEGAEFGAWSS